MTFGRLIFMAFSRNWLRSFFTFVAIVAAFCLFGALETIRYEREGPSTDQDLIIVQPDGMGTLPPSYEDKILAMKGVQGATGMAGLPVQNVKAPATPLILLGVNAARLRQTFPEMGIAPEVLSRWRSTRIGALSDRRTAQDMGWKVGDRISLPLILGMRTASGDSQLEVILLGLNSAGGPAGSGALLIRYDYLIELFPQNAQLATIYVRPSRASDARSIAERIDLQFRSGPAQTLSAPLYEFRRTAAKDASTILLVIRGALAISFFTMLLIVTNALTQSVRERIGEMAVLEAVGFQHRTIVWMVFAEGLVLFVFGAALGLVLASVGFSFEIAGMRSDLEVLPLHTMLLGGAYALVCALIAALLPWRELAHLRVAEALGRL